MPKGFDFYADQITYSTNNGQVSQILRRSRNMGIQGCTDMSPCLSNPTILDMRPESVVRNRCGPSSLPFNLSFELFSLTLSSTAFINTVRSRATRIMCSIYPFVSMAGMKIHLFIPYFRIRPFRKTDFSIYLTSPTSHILNSRSSSLPAKCKIL